MRKWFLIIAIAFFAINVSHAQSKDGGDLKFSLDCADVNFVVKGSADKCVKFVLKGPDANEYEFVTAIVSIMAGSILKEFMVSGAELSDELKAAMKKIPKGEHLFIENAKVKNNKSGIVKTLPASKITFK
jgi:hypothetical protein